MSYVNSLSVAKRRTIDGSPFSYLWSAIVGALWCSYPDSHGAALANAHRSAHRGSELEVSHGSAHNAAHSAAHWTTHNAAHWATHWTTIVESQLDSQLMSFDRADSDSQHGPFVVSIEHSDAYSDHDTF